MRFLVDAHLPRRLAYQLAALGHDALHTLDLPAGNRTSDSQINELSFREQRVVITKDADFVNSFRVLHRPHKLLLISTGNITNAELEGLLVPQLERLVEMFATHDFVELTRMSIVVHS